MSARKSTAKAHAASFAKRIAAHAKKAPRARHAAADAALIKAELERGVGKSTDNQLS